MSTQDVAIVKQLKKKNLDEIYRDLGTRVVITEKINEFEKSNKRNISKEKFLEEKMIIPTDLREVGLKFLKKYWKKIAKQVCNWWEKNKDEKINDKFIEQLIEILKKILPSPWNLISGIVAYIVAIILKNGPKIICERFLIEPPLT
jgi:hypothetical protein